MGEEGSGRTRCAEVLHELSETPLPLRMVTAEAPEEVEEPAVVVLREPERFDDALQRFWAGEIHRVRGKSSPIERVLVVSRGAAPGAAPPFHPHLWREVSKLQVEVPALRDRGPDLPPLARELAREAARRLGREPLQLADEVCEVLARASWVGNVAELERIIEKAVARAAGAFLGGAALEEAIRLDIEQRRDGLARQRVARRGAEREQLISLLDECGGNVAEISRRLGLTRGAVTYRLKKHGLAV